MLDKTALQLICGFLGILIIGLLIFLGTGYYGSYVSIDSQKTVRSV